MAKEPLWKLRKGVQKGKRTARKLSDATQRTTTRPDRGLLQRQATSALDKTSATNPEICDLLIKMDELMDGIARHTKRVETLTLQPEDFNSLIKFIEMFDEDKTDLGIMGGPFDKERFDLDDIVGETEEVSREIGTFLTEEATEKLEREEGEVVGFEGVGDVREQRDKTNGRLEEAKEELEGEKMELEGEEEELRALGEAEEDL